jgi:phosphate uptake regulator
VESFETISELVGKELARTADSHSNQWHESRKLIGERVKNLHSRYRFAMKLPPDELGMSALAAMSNLISVQYSFAQIFVMIDMLHGQTFDEVFMDSMVSISEKVTLEISTLKKMIETCAASSDETNECFKEILRLEREIDEDNIIVCRQISVATKGESDTICYLMRKIVRELEHISDYVKECAEILADF